MIQFAKNVWIVAMVGSGWALGSLSANAGEDFRDGYFSTAIYDEVLGDYVSTIDGQNGFVIEGLNTNDRLGFTVSGAGDVNRDGVDDLLIGGNDATYVVFGSSAGFASSFDLASLDGQNGFVITGDGVGWGVTAAGDINGDGVDDVATAGANGSVYVVFGSAAPFAPTVPVASLDADHGLTIATPGQLTRRFAVSGAGDINGDGIADLAIGGNGNGDFGGRETRSYVVFGSAAGWGGPLDVDQLDGVTGFRILGGPTTGFPEQTISGSGDINGDGLADLLIGQPLASFEGQAFVVYGSATSFSPTFDLGTLDGENGFVLHGDTSGFLDRAGWSVSGAGDVNGDGVDDMLLGAPGYDLLANFTHFVGQTFVVFGSAAGHPANVDLGALDGSNGFLISGDCGVFYPFDGSCSSSDSAGDSVSAAGDVNGDGLADILIGAPGYSFSAEAYVIYGSTAGFPARFDVGSTDESSGLLDGTNGFAYEDPIGSAVSTFTSGVGDINGDGLADIAIGDSDASSGGRFGVGRVTIVFGKPQVSIPEPSTGILALLSTGVLLARLARI